MRPHAEFHLTWNWVRRHPDEAPTIKIGREGLIVRDEQRVARMAIPYSGRSLFLQDVALPDAVRSQAKGRRLCEIVDHPLFLGGSPWGEAIVSSMREKEKHRPRTPVGKPGSWCYGVCIDDHVPVEEIRLRRALPSMPRAQSIVLPVDFPIVAMTGDFYMLNASLVPPPILSEAA